MQESFIPLNKEYIKANIFKNNIIIDILESINSTNVYLKELPYKKTPRICIAEQQTQGKGRFGRNWHSPFAENIYISFSYPFRNNIKKLSGLSLVVAIAVIEAINIFFPTKKIMAKWPNDIIYKGKKLAGILIDINKTPNEFYSTIIGIGINVNMKIDKDNRISQEWISMCKILGSDIDRNIVCVSLINVLLDYLEIFSKNGLIYFTEKWSEVDYLLDQKVFLNTSNKKIVGISKGVDRFGHLLLELPDGVVKTFTAGDVSVFL